MVFNPSTSAAGTTERVLSLLSLLQSRPVWTGPELAERLGVTTRSIRRDVDRLRNLGYPVRAGQGVGGGYQLGAGKALPPLLLDDTEAVAIAVSLRLAAGSSGSMNEAALRTLAKLDQVLPARLRGQVRGVHQTTMTLDHDQDQVDLDLLLILARACWATERVRFDYTAASGRTTERRVEPYRVVKAGRHWYLLGFDLDRDDWRTLRLDRMTEVTSTGWRFTARSAPDPAEFVRNAIAVAPYAFTARCLIQAPAGEVTALVPGAAVVVEPIDDASCLLVSGGDDLGLMAWHLARLPFTIDPLDPPELRQAMRDLSERLAQIAGRPDVGADPGAGSVPG